MKPWSVESQQEGKKEENCLILITHRYVIDFTGRPDQAPAGTVDLWHHDRSLAATMAIAEDRGRSAPHTDFRIWSAWPRRLMGGNGWGVRQRFSVATQDAETWSSEGVTNHQPSQTRPFSTFPILV
jgi:hypothetical protein